MVRNVGRQEQHQHATWTTNQPSSHLKGVQKLPTRVNSDKLNKSSTSQTNSTELVPQFEMERAAPCIHRRTNRETNHSCEVVSPLKAQEQHLFDTQLVFENFFFFHTLRKETLPSGLRRYNENLIKKKLNKNMRQQGSSRNKLFDTSLRFNVDTFSEPPCRHP